MSLQKKSEKKLKTYAKKIGVISISRTPEICYDDDDFLGVSFHPWKPRLLGVFRGDKGDSDETTTTTTPQNQATGGLLWLERRCGFQRCPAWCFFLARRKYGTSRGERNGGEIKLNLWWFLCAKILVGWDFHWTSNVHFQSAEGWPRWYIHLQNSWRWGALAQFSWQMLLAMLYRCFSDTPTVCVSASLKSSSSNEELLGPPSHVETWGQTGDSSSRRDTWDLLILQEDHPKGWWTSRTLTLTTWCCNLSTSINIYQQSPREIRDRIWHDFWTKT